MSNPARELLQIFDGWNVEGSVQSKRQMQKLAGANSVRRAMRLIEEIHQALDELEPNVNSMDLYRSAARSWVNNIIAYPVGWSDQQGGTKLHSVSRIDMLQSLAILLDASPVRVDLHQAKNFEMYLSGIINLLGEDEGIDDALRAHIAKLIAHIRSAFDVFKATGRFDADDALTQLWVSLLAAEARSKGRKGSWKKFATELRNPVTSGVIVSLPILAIEAAKLLS